MVNLAQLRPCFVAGTLEHGGAERQLFYTLRALCQAGAAPRVLSLDQGQFWEERIKALGVPVTWVGQQASRLKRLVRVVKVVRQDPVQVLQSQHFYANAYVGVAARLLRMSGIGAMRNNGRTEVNGCGWVGGWANLHLPPTIAANSRRAIQYATSRGIAASRLYFLPNVVDTDWFKPPTHAAAGGSVRLIAVGRLVKQKRLDRFLALLAQVRAELGLNVTGVIAGPGCQEEDLRPELEAQARALGLLPHALEFRGGVSDMRPVYHQAAVCVLTSDFEGTPNVLLEAMACGLPVVATQVGGVPEIVRHGETGFLAEPDDLQAQASALADLVRNPGLRAQMGCRARACIEASHAVHRLPGHLAGLYGQALPSGRRRATRAVQGASS